MARILIVGCGCRGRALAASLDGHAVRGTTRSEAAVSELAASGIEGVAVDPDRLATLLPALSGVTVICWLMGSAASSPEVHGTRLRTLMEHLVDTPVRGLVYEGAGTVDGELLEQGAEIVRTASRTWHIPSEIVSIDPADHETWLAAMNEAVERLLSG